MARRPCIDCQAIAPPGATRCAPCQATIDRAKWSRNPNRDPDYRKLRAEIARRLPLPCHLCGQPITHTGHDRWALTLDHLVPWSDGGSNDPRNLRPAHKHCNSSRGRHDHGG